VQVGSHHANLIVFLVQIMEKDVAQRHHAPQFSALADQQVAEPVAPHQSHAGFQTVFGFDGEGILGHDIAYRGTCRILSGVFRDAPPNLKTFISIALNRLRTNFALSYEHAKIIQ